MTVVFSSFGARGDIWPYMAMARAVQKSGHRAIVATSARFQAEIEGLGLEFRAVLPDSPTKNDWRAIMSPFNGTETLVRRHILPDLARGVDQLRAVVQTENADVLVSHTLSLAAPIVAQLEAQNGLKWVSCAVSPLALLNRDCVLPALPFLANFPLVNGWTTRLLRRQFGLWLRPVEDLRESLGLSRGTNALWDDAHSPLLRLNLWPREFCEIDEKKRRVCSGFCFPDEPEMPENIARFLQNGAAPLVLVAASFSENPDFVAQSLKAAQILEKRALFLGVAPFQTQNALGVGFGPLGQILEKSAALISQGGIGTLALGFRAGVGQVVSPFSHDQFDNARRAQKLGLAHVVSSRNYRAPVLAAALENLKPPNAIWARENGAETAAHLILKV